MVATAATLKVRGLKKQMMTELAKQALRLGITPELYVKQVVEESLEIARRARSKTFAELTGPGREVDEAELDKFVEKAKARHYRNTRRKR